LKRLVREEVMTQGAGREQGRRAQAGARGAGPAQR
jgi:hypothetical protein